VAEPNDAEQVEFEAEKALALSETTEAADAASTNIAAPVDRARNTSKDENAVEDEMPLQEQVQHQTNRIRALEQALDQSLASLDELQLQIVDQHFLERQLASTEEYANVQEQAIYQLRLQFEQQKTELEAQIQQTQDRLRAAESLADAQQLELDQLRSLTEHSIEGSHELPNVPSTLDLDPSESGERPPQPRESQKAKPRDWLAPKEWLRHAPKERVTELEGQVQELETQVTRQATTQMMLQQACQELEHDREHSQHRIAELERQAAEMQEQILSQAQQASEYETAIQHWKNRFYGIQAKALVLRKLLEENGLDLPEEMADLLASLEEASMAEPRMAEPRIAEPRIAESQPTPRRNPFNEDLKIDLPDFLARRRTRKLNS
jgi:predicted RNase H-like nuclease (RuvC/YqgF family)